MFPDSGPNSTFNARFRLYPSAPINPTTAWTGTAPGGEVEDYQWGFKPTAVSLSKLNAAAAVAPAGISAGGLGLAMLGAWVLIRRRRR